MENETQKDDNVASQETVNDNSESENNNDLVAYKTYSKVLGKAKKVESERNELAEKVKLYEQNEQEKKGNYEDVIKSLRNELDETKSALKNKEQSFAWNSIENQIKQAAGSEGCEFPDKLMKLLDGDDLKGLEIGDNYQVNSDDMGRLLNKAKKENEFLFGKKKINVNNVAPNSVTAPKKDVKNMSAAEHKEYVLKNFS